MTEPNMEWEDEFERAWMRTIYKGGFLQEHTNIPQAILVKSFIRQAISEAEQRGAAEEREQMVIAVEEIKKNISEMNDDSYINAKVDACNTFLSLLHHKK